MKKIKSNKLEIGVCCKTKKEHLVMLTLIVFIQSCYNRKFRKAKRVSFRRLAEMAVKGLEERGSPFYPFPEEEEK